MIFGRKSIGEQGIKKGKLVGALAGGAVVAGACIALCPAAATAAAAAMATRAGARVGANALQKSVEWALHSNKIRHIFLKPGRVGFMSELVGRLEVVKKRLFERL